MAGSGDRFQHFFAGSFARRGAGLQAGKGIATTPYRQLASNSFLIMSEETCIT